MLLRIETLDQGMLLACPSGGGGSLIEWGLDTNRNGLLDDLEVKSFTYVCNGVVKAPPVTAGLIEIKNDVDANIYQTATSLGDVIIYDTRPGSSTNNDIYHAVTMGSLTYAASPIGKVGQLTQIYTPYMTTVIGDVTIKNAPQLTTIFGVQAGTTRWTGADLIIRGNLDLENCPKLCKNIFLQYISQGHLRVLGTVTLTGLKDVCTNP